MLKSEDKSFIVKLLIGAGVVIGGSFIVYEVLVGPLNRKKDELAMWMREYAREYKEFAEETGGALTPTQEETLEWKREQMERVSEEITDLGGKLWEFLSPIAIAAAVAIVLKYFPYMKVSKAISYIRTHGPKVKNAADATALLRTSMNHAFYGMGYVSLATASQTSTRLWATNVLYPTMNASITYLQGILPTLSGTALIWANYMIATSQIGLTWIPTLLAIPFPMGMALQIQPDPSSRIRTRKVKRIEEFDFSSILLYPEEVEACR